MRNKSLLLGVVALCAVPAVDLAQTMGNNLIANPDFTPTNGVPSPRQITVSGSVAFSGTQIAPWTANGLVFLFGPASGASGTNADIGNGAANFFNPTPSAANNGFCLWGPGPCGRNVPASIQSPPDRLSLGPDGGNFVALDGALSEPGGRMIRGSISQTITGLEVGVPATVMFNWAAGQQATFLGDTTERLEVSLCPTTGTCPSTDMQTTATLVNPERGFRHWRAGVTATGGSFTFTPTSASEVLTFLGIGTPVIGTANGGPPFVLLDSPSLIEHGVPEPGTWSLLGFGLAAIVGVAYRRHKRLGLPA